MKISTPQQIAVVIAAVVSFAFTSLVASPFQTQDDKPQDGMIEFNFSKSAWPVVIEWYAEQAGLVLDTVDQYPEGSFTYVSNGPISPLEAIDKINHKLRLSEPSKVLLRNGDRLYLVDAGRAIREELVETVTPEELDGRGIYEPLSVMFDVSGLNLDDLKKDLLQRVQPYNEDFFHVFPDTNQIFVRETGGNLRFMRDIINRAKSSGKLTNKRLSLKHISPELFLDQISRFHDLDEDYHNPEGTLMLQTDLAPGSQDLIVRGTPAMIADIDDLRALFDVETEFVASSPDDPQTLKWYLVPRDAQEMFEIIDRELFEAGRGARVSLGSETGKITVRGRAADHKIVREVLSLQESGGGLETVRLANGKATDVLLSAQTMLGITAENIADKVTMLANVDANAIVLKGTAAQVIEARLLIEELDRNEAPQSDGIRTQRRFVPMPPADRDRILGTLEDRWPTMGRSNRFIVRPPRKTEDDGSLLRRRTRAVQPSNSAGSGTKGGSGTRDGSGTKAQGSFIQDQAFQFAACAFPAATLQLSTALLQSPDDPSPGDKEVYQLPKQVKSVPGAAVYVWGTEDGIIIESDDLDAGDDVVYMIDDQLDEKSEFLPPVIFELKHVEANHMKSLLESLCGIESSGGGGGAGGLLENVANNAFGEAGGGVVDSLFGGGGGSSGDSILEGEVSLGVDGRLNFLWVNGATGSDLELIDDLVLKFDVSSAPHSPETAGQIYVINVKHRAPDEMKTAVESLMAETYFSSADGGGGNGGGGNQPNIARLVQQQLNPAGSGANDAAEKKPRGFLGVDAKTSSLTFMGPKSIFVQVEVLVNLLDQPDFKEDRVVKKVDMRGSNALALLKSVQDIYGSKIVVAGDSETEEEMPEESNPARGTAEPRAAAAAQARQEQQQAARAIQQAIRAQQGGRGGGRGNRGGGGGGRGNRGGGGGGRGGR